MSNPQFETLNEAVETFFRLELELNERSKMTIRWYRNRLDAMCKYLGPDKSPAKIRPLDLLNWLSTLKRREYRYGDGTPRPKKDGGLSVNTQRGHVRALRRFWSWLYKNNFIRRNPASELPMPHKPKLARRGISDADQDAIITAAVPTCDQYGNLRRSEIQSIRDYAILCFLSATGCRLGGIAHLTLIDLQLEHPDKQIRHRAYVVEKGTKGRYVFMNDQAITAMRTWLLVRPGCDSDHVFIGCKNGKLSWFPLAEEGLYYVVRKYAIKAGVYGKPGVLWSPHQWRHRFGRRWLERGGDLSRLAQLLGHSTSQITSEHYGQLEIDVLQDGYDQILGG